MTIFTLHQLDNMYVLNVPQIVGSAEEENACNADMVWNWFHKALNKIALKFAQSNTMSIIINYA